MNMDDVFSPKSCEFCLLTFRLDQNCVIKSSHLEVDIFIKDLYLRRWANNIHYRYNEDVDTLRSKKHKQKIYKVLNSAFDHCHSINQSINQ